jgi:hypothetical protein
VSKSKGRKGKNRVPLAAQTAAQPKKIPRVGEDVDFWSSHPIWSFAFLDLCGVAGWIHLKQENLDELLARFQQWERMTWSQILSEGGKKKNHKIDVFRCSAEAQERLKFLGMEDREELMSLAVNSKARVIGILDRAIFHILWWDPGHQVVPSHQKHT